MQVGAFLALFFAWNVSQTFEELESKWSIMIPIISITGVHALTIVHSVIAGLIVEMLFMLFSAYNTA